MNTDDTDQESRNREIGIGKQEGLPRMNADLRGLNQIGELIESDSGTKGQLDFWQEEEKCGAVPNCAFDSHGAAMVENNMLYDCQTKSGTAAFTRACFIHAIEALEDAWQMFRRDAGAEVAHEELNAVFVLMRPNNDLLAILRIAQGVADEVAEDLVHRVAIGQHRPIRYVFHCEFHLGGAGILLHGRSRFSKQNAGGMRTQIELFFARFHARQNQQVFREAAHALGIAADDLKKVASAVIEQSVRLKQRLRVSANGSERRAQFMRDVGDEIAPCFFHALDFGDVMEHGDNATIGQRLRRKRKRAPAGKGSDNRAFPPLGLQSGVQRSEKIRMPQQFNHRRADAHALMENATDRLIGPANFHVRGNGNHSVSHAVEQSFQFRAALTHGGKIFFQTPRSAVQGHSHLAYFVSAGYGNARGKISGSNLPGETHNAAQAARNNFSNNDCQHKGKQQSQDSSPEKIGTNGRNLLLHAGKRISQANYFVATGNGQIKKFNAHGMAYARRTARVSGESRHHFWPAGMVFHGFRISFRIGKHHAIAGNDGDAGLRDAGFFIGHLLQRMLVVILNTQRKALSILDKEFLNVVVHRVFPGVPDADVQRERGRGYYRDKRAHGFQEDAVSHLAASNLYPAPRTVLRYMGSSGSCSIFSRSRRIYTSTERGVTKDRSRHTASST